MESVILNQLSLLMPEIAITMLAILGQLFAVFCDKRTSVIVVLSLLGCAAVAVMVPNIDLAGSDKTFVSGFRVSGAIGVFKILVIIFAIAAMLSYQSFCRITNSEIKYEFITLLMLSLVGSLVAISATNFLLLFSGLELQALSGYALAAFNSSNARSSEAGLKYFVLGALVSCISLLGMSFIYGFSGSLQFADSLIALRASDGLSIGLVIGLILMLTSIFFKLSAAPMHVWTPDVYEGAPIAAVMYFATAQKIAVLAVLMNLIELALNHYHSVTVSLIKVMAILSMVVGSLGALGQTSLKRLMAYSTILNVGYVLIAVCLSNTISFSAAVLYMMIYAAATCGFFACLIAALGSKTDSATFEDIQGFGVSKKALAGAISILMFSMVGIPPLAGFFGKYYIFYNAILKGEFGLAITGIITSVIAAYYYLKVVKCMYFVAPQNYEERIPTNFGLLLVTCVMVGFILCFALIPIPYFKLLMVNM